MTQEQAKYNIRTSYAFPYPMQTWAVDNGSDPKTFGIDVSRWQTDPTRGNTVDYHQCFQDGVKYAAIRCTVGDYYTDPYFAEFWEGFSAAGILCTPYIVVAPAWSEEWKNRPVSAQEHWADFMRVFGDRVPDLPIALDCELTRNQSPSYIADLIDELVWMVRETFDRFPIIYTRGNWWNENTVPRESFGMCDLWIARYNTAIEHPWEDNEQFRPRDWENWTFWQYSEEGSIDGIPNSHVDLDWYNGTLEHLLEYAEQPTTPDPPDPPPVDPDIEHRVEAIEAELGALNATMDTFAGALNAQSAYIRENTATLTDHEERIAALEAHEVKDTVTATAIDKVVAFYVYDFNAAGKPIMVKYEPVIRYNTGQRFEVYPERHDADGTIDYYRMELEAEVPVYCRADKLRI